MQAAGPIVKTVISSATSLIQKKWQLLQGVEKEIENLSSTLMTIQSVLEDAEERQFNDKPVRDWLGELKDVAYDAEDILETFATEAYQWQKKQQVRTFRPPLSKSEIGYKLEVANEIKDILERLDKIAKKKEQFGLNVDSNVNKETTYHDQGRNTTSSLVVESDVVGREDDRNKIVDRLVLPEYDREAGDISVVPIIGLGGLGKTTLAQVVYNDDRVKNHFEFRMWVCVTVNFDYRRILKEMIEYHTEMNYSINSLSDNQLESRLLEFMARKRFLLVLDDVWIHSYPEWEKLSKLLKLGGKGSRVLVTGRETRVSEVMGVQRPDTYLLEYLPEDQCWSLFEKIAFINNNNVHHPRGDLENIGREIVGKCKGLPLAVKAMAGILRGNNDVDKWKRILKHEIWEAEADKNINTGKQTVLPALKLSYDHLPSHLKQCFAFCYVFPKGHVFDKEELVKVWKAESFILQNDHDTLDEIGNDYFNGLLMRSFFQVLNTDNMQRYRMHDLIHDLAQSISSPHCYQVKDNESCSHISKTSRHVSFHCKDIEKPVLQVIEKSKRLRSLLLPSDYQPFGQALDKLFHSMKYMRMLDLSSGTLTELPSSVQDLKLLHYLDLSRTEIKLLPNSICNLYNLQTLKLLGCLWLFELPKDLGDLVNLEHLELDDLFWFKVSKLPPRTGNLTGLQNLHAFPISHESGCGIDELKSLKFLKGTLHISKLENAVNAAEVKLKDKERLQKVVFEWSNSNGGPQDEEADETVLKDLQPHANIQELQLFCYKGTRFSSWIGDGFLKNLVSLSFKHCSKCKVLSLGQLEHLRMLDIKGMLELEEWPEEQYPSLHRLKISDCPKLSQLPSIFPAMAVLKIKKCNSLKTLPLTPTLRFLILMDNLVLEDWNEKFIHSVDGQGRIGAVLGSTFTNLLELKVINCPKLQQLPGLFFPQKLDISGCQLFSTLPIPGHARRLQHLALDSCRGDTLVRAIPDTSSLYSLVISNISGLTCLPKLPHLPGLKALHIHHCSDLVSLSEEESSFQGLPSLTLLSIQDCPQLETLPEQGLPTTIECLSIVSCSSLMSLGPNEMLKNLISLKDFCLNDCPALQSFPEEGLPMSLQHLHIEGCPLLLERCQQESGTDWPKIMQISDLELETMKIKQPEVTPSSAAWYRRFICCKGIDPRERATTSAESTQLNAEH